VNPVAFEIGALRIYWYGVLVALGCMAGLWLAGRRAQRAGVPADTIWDLGPWLILGGLVGARAWFVIAYWRESFADQPLWEILRIRGGGMVFYGGLIGGTLGGVVFARRKQLGVWHLADILAPSIALGQAFGRLGCLMTGCCYGRPSSLPWAIHFPHDHETAGAGVHPTQIYESLLDFGLYGLLAWAFRRKHFDGQVFAGYLVGYAALRSAVELFRGDYRVHYLGGWVTPGHLSSFGVLATGLALWWMLAPKRPTPSKST
jgi:phosphatidylglycerol:prolipoprotein diacylglycerol transferase